MSLLSMSLSPLVGVRKTGLIKPDENGYYLCSLGAFEAFNAVGDYYPIDKMVRALFDASSEMQRRAAKGALRGEMEHPEPRPDEAPAEYLARAMDISKDRESHLIRGVYLDEKNVRDNGGRLVIGTFGMVKPSGVYGHLLKQSFSDPNENVAFSIRSVAENFPMRNRRLRRHVRKIITWDWVTEGGIEVADKYWSPAFENRKTAEGRDLIITKSLAMEAFKSVPVGVLAMESRRQGVESLLQTFGWDSDLAELFNW